MKKPQGKTADESRVEMVKVVLPNDANPLGNILTNVAVDEHGRPKTVLPVIPRSAEEKPNYCEALIRRRHRLALAARAHPRYFEK